MSRRPIAFSCGPDTLAGVLDCADAHGMTGLLIVSGGNEIRAGAFAGMALLAARLAQEAGVPVFRYDRRGVGDSEGENTGWRGSRDDIAAALAAFRTALPGMRRVVGFGVCDAASALVLHGGSLDGLVLANPWTYDTDDADSHSPGALRRRYLAKLADPRALWRLLSGKVDLGKLRRGLEPPRPSPICSGQGLRSLPARSRCWWQRVIVSARPSWHNGPTTIRVCTSIRATVTALAKTRPAPTGSMRA